MDYRGINELRELFLRFFEDKGHCRMESFPLVPQDDKSLLLINSGMAPLKKYFLGQDTVPGNRATTCQKCIRTPDIERVGKTARHGTFFEMLGNFSFGDYFKSEACAWAWEFLTETVGMDKERLHCSVFLDDDEAWDIWTKEVGVPEDHMIRLGREDNFWEIGSGPCGPCSEIYYDRGAERGCGSPDCAPGCDCDRYVEIWNLVFTQFISDGEGNYAKMEKPNIDTGMGLERLGCMVQDVENLFEVDTIRNIMRHVERVAGATYKDSEQTDVSLRVITDHIRSTVFMIGDGVAPGNEGRGYVLRRLLRRAARHGRLLGINRPFLYEVCDTVIAENATAYPDLARNADYIKKVIRVEEERFEKTIHLGLAMMSEVIGSMQSRRETMLSGALAFKLNDTYGFPLDLIREMLEEKGFAVDEEGFRRLMAEQKVRAREDAKKKDVSWESDRFRDLDAEKTEFTGYDELTSEAHVVYLVAGGEAADSASEGDAVQIILDRTPFYAEGGGQVGDRGTLTSDNAAVEIDGCHKTAEGYYVHTGTVTRGLLENGERVTAAVDAEARWATMRNHTGAHLLQAALREVLGGHVHQSGSYVDSSRLRFDFSHFEAVSPEELRRVEEIINRKILENVAVRHQSMPVEEAKKMGAIALFGEKYADVVRVIEVTDFSMELCGGTHVNATGNIGLFKILSESSVAAGIRRIEATTGLGVLEVLAGKQAILDDVSAIFKINNEAELGAKARLAVSALKNAEAQIEQLRARRAAGAVDDMMKTFETAGGAHVYTARLDENADALRAAADTIRRRDPLAVAVLASAAENKVTLCAAVGTEALALGYRAGTLVKEIAALVGGSGGGKPEMAMAGGKDLSKIPAALSAVVSIVAGNKQGD